MDENWTEERLIQTVDIFYNDIIDIYNKRIKKNNEKITQNLKEEEEIKEKINNFQKKIDKINENPENHINKKIEYHLIPVMYEESDKYEKEKYYLEKELEFMKNVHEEEKKEILEKNQDYLKKNKKYIDEKVKIISCIENKRLEEILKKKKLQDDELNNLRNQNDEFIRQFSN